MFAILVQILLLQILPICKINPKLLLHHNSLIETVCLIIMLYTQPKLVKSDVKTDKYSIYMILIGLLLSIVSTNLEWAMSYDISQSISISFVLGLIIAASGITIRLWAISTLGKFFHSTVKCVEGQNLIENGPYRYIRHPSYSGALLSILGLSVMLETYWSLLLSVVLLFPAYYYRIWNEEKLLKTVFSKYQIYSEKTHRLIPYIW
jgi:protein-S-isoprenylcysteine O-methyltransferase Ste14